MVEMLTKNPPNSDAGNIGQLVMRIATQKMSYTLPSNVSAESDKFLKSLLVFQPGNRPSAAQALDHAYLRNTAV